MCKRVNEKTVSVRETELAPVINNNATTTTTETREFTAEHYQPRTYVSSVTIILLRWTKRGIKKCCTKETRVPRWWPKDSRNIATRIHPFVSSPSTFRRIAVAMPVTCLHHLFNFRWALIDFIGKQGLYGTNKIWNLFDSPSSFRTIFHVKNVLTVGYQGMKVEQSHCATVRNVVNFVLWVVWTFFWCSDRSV